MPSYGSDLVRDAQSYKSVVGALQYATIIRPEIVYCVNCTCRYMHNPLEAH